MYSLCSSPFVPNNGLILDIKKLENIQLIHTLCTCDTINDFLVSLRAFGERYILKKSKNDPTVKLLRNKEVIIQDISSV